MVEETPQLESFPVPIEESTPGGWRLQKRFAEVGAHWTDFEKDRKNGVVGCVQEDAPYVHFAGCL